MSILPYPPLDSQDITAKYELLLAEHQATVQELARKDALLAKVSAIISNKNQTYSYRVMTLGLMMGHPDEVLLGKPFEIDVLKERSKVGVGQAAATEYFGAMHDAGGATYKAQVVKIGEKHITKSAIQFHPNFEQVNTKDSERSVKQREAVANRREEKLKDVSIVECPNCHNTHESQAFTVLVPVVTV